MKKQKLTNIHSRSYFSSIFKGKSLVFLFLFLGIIQPIFGQDLSPCASIQVIGTSENTADNGGAVFQGILVSNPITPNQAVRIYNRDWELVEECTSSECGNPFTFPTSAGKYFVQVQLFKEDKSWLCQSDPIEVIVDENNDPCQSFCNQELIEFRSQADIDNFCGCEVIKGDVRITAEDITSLEPLNSLKSVEGFLAIFETGLADLQGLDNLQSVGDGLVILENGQLRNFKGLSKLESITSIFYSGQNPILQSFEGLNSLQEINGGVDISGNDRLIDISALENIQKATYVQITGNASLPNLEGFHQLTSIGEGPTQGGDNFKSLLIGGNAALTNLNALSNLQVITENITIQFNSSLESCCGIAHLIDNDPNNGQGLSSFSINDNAEGCNSVEEILAHCQGASPSCDNLILSGEDGKIVINNLNAPIEIIKIYNENWERVFECAADCDDPTIFETEAGKYYVQVQLYTENWEWICQTENLKVIVEEENCNEPTPICQGDVILSTQAEIDAFCGCEYIEGSLIISGSEVDPIVSLNNLNTIKSITNSLIISSTQLSDLSGLEKLMTIDLISLVSNSNLKSLDGIGSLESLNFLNLSVNTSLVDIQALSNINRLSLLFIVGNTALTGLSGLENLTTIGEEGDTSSSILIGGNSQLSSLDGLAGLQEVYGSLRINRNTALSDCCSITNLIDEDPFNGQILGDIELFGNPENCNSVEAILENCSNPLPNCDDVEVDISELIIENGEARRQVTISFNTPDQQRTGITVYDRSPEAGNQSLLSNCGICEGDSVMFTLVEGEYAILVDRSYLNINISNVGCNKIFFIDVPAEPCIDMDGDYICGYNECNDNDPEVKDLILQYGIPCDDGDDTTREDIIQEDGCTCAGTPISANPCDDISLSLNQNSEGVIDVKGKTGGKEIIKVYDEHWNVVRDCSSLPDIEAGCDSFGPFEPGLYRVYVQQYTSDWQYICETDFLEIEVPEVQNDSRNAEDFINEKDIVLFPNPVQNTLNIRTRALKGKEGSIQIFNTFGQLIEERSSKIFQSDTETIEVDRYQNGLYLMTIKAGNSRIISKRFFVDNLK